MLDVPAFIHFRRAGRQLVGSYHLWCIERDAGRGFRYVDVMESDALTSAVLMPDTKSAPLSDSYSITAPSEKMPGSKKAVSSSPPMASNNTCSPTEGAHHTRERPAREVSQFNRPGHDTSLVEVDIGHNAGANEISKKT